MYRMDGDKPNLKQVVPLFGVASMAVSVRYYVDGLGFRLGQGVSFCFMCADALAMYHEVTARGIEARKPFVGNGLWVTSLVDPDGYRLEFQSPTDVAEDTVYGG